MNKEQLLQWYTLREQIVNGWHMSESDWQELHRLNHLIMDASHKIHNDHMLEGK